MGIEMPDINKIRKEIDEKNAEMEKKERERIKEEYEGLSEQEKLTEEKLEEKSEEKVEQSMRKEDIAEELTPENVKAAENVKATYKKGGKEKEKEDGSSRRRFLEARWVELNKKNYKTLEEIQKIKNIEKEHQELSDQIKKGEVGKKKEPKEAKKEEAKEEKTELKKEGKELKIEKEIIANYYEELEKIKSIPENTNKQKKQKAEEYFELIDRWKDQGHKDNYKGIQKIISELNKLEPEAWFYNLAKTQNINKVAIAMASNYKEWNLEGKEKTKIIKKIINKQKKGFWENKDKTLKQVAEILASQETPYKDNIEFIIKDIKDPNIKTEAITKISGTEKKSIEQKKQLLKKIKEEAKEEKIDIKNLENIASLLGMGEKIKDPEVISKIFSESSEIMKNPDVQKKWQELTNTIEKVIKKEGKTPDAVTKATEFIKKEGKGKDKEKKDSKWKTGIGVFGQGILLFLIIVMLLELKGVDYLVGQTSGGGKKK